MAVIATLLLTSCDLEKKSKRGYHDSEIWGKVVTKEIEGIAKYHEIELNGNIDIKYKQSDTLSAKLYGNEKAIALAEVLVSDGKLTARHTDDASDAPTVTLYISGPSLDIITANGAGDITLSHGIDTDSDIIVTANGTGDINLKGVKCNDLKITANGTGDVDTKKVKCKNVIIEAKGTGEVYFKKIKAKGNANISSDGSGNVEGKVKAESISAVSHGSGNVELEVECTDISVISEGTSNITVKGEAETLTKGKGQLGEITTKDLKANKVINK